MRKQIIFVVLFAMSSGFAAAQQPLQKRNLEPARGHYLQLSGMEKSAKADVEAMDTLKFPFDRSLAERRLSLKPIYLTEIKEENFDLPDPPANSSVQTRAELNYLLHLQQQRTEDEIRSALHKADIYYNPRISPGDSAYNHYRKNLFYIGRSIGTWFNPETLPKTADLMAQVWQDASYFIWMYKYKYLRVRPFVLEPSLQALQITNWAAYPSGHAANSYINAYIYQELAPQFKDIFIKDAYDMAHSREIIGVHYPSDSEASRIFARQFVNKLFEHPQFIKTFEAVKNEWEEKAKESFEKPVVSTTCKKENAKSCAKTCEE